MTFSHLHYKSSGKTIAKLAVQLSQFDQGLVYHDWVLALLVIINETGGSEEGFELANAWSSAGPKPRGTKYVRAKWLWLKRMHVREVQMDTLISMAKEAQRRSGHTTSPR